MELQRNINNKNYLFCFITVISCFVFGYILPVRGRKDCDMLLQAERVLM